MDDQVDVSAAEPQVVAGPSGRTRKRNVSSSSSSTTSSSSSSSSSPKRTKRSRRSRRKKNKRARQSNSTLGKLIKEVQELREQVFVNNTHNACHDGLSVCSGVSGELYDQHFEEQTECPNVDDKNSQLDFTFDIETKLKEPSVPKTPENLLKMLLDVQRLGSSAWSEVRYSDTQKLYNHSPGFIDLDTNEEIKMYDTLRHLAHADKSYAAITFCILKQKESLQEAIRNLLLWAKSTQVNYDNLSGKVEELFQKGDLHKISSDLLQLVCGHRAESIEMRRDAITTQIRHPLVKASLNRIPPTSTHLFSPDLFATALEKAGGVRKAFWPPKSESHTRSNQGNRRPSRGLGVHKPIASSREAQHCICCHEPGIPIHMHTYDNTPSRGGYFRTNHVNKGQSLPSFQSDQYASRGSFHNRGSRSDRGSNRSRGRSSHSKSSRGNQKRYKQ
ncbi:uncharacterized protein LOC126912861 [Spodoptera frugiperda]|uniref:Uncharacterized protein LOC126912861 n=1 Tax=Spodoptera frugiperda TaxID=7108 RepID=A0A9R0EBX9_SPOFR|nr:uncharacterized protein LOC126912861 [Spodoptera frugiperda]